MLIRYSLEEALEALRQKLDSETYEQRFMNNDINIQIMDEFDSKALVAGPFRIEPKEEAK